jgi:hypothetical protein
MTLRAVWRGGLAALALAILAGAPAAAQRQPLYQSGIALPNAVAKFTAPGLVTDGHGLNGDINGSGLLPFGISDSLGLGVCTNSANTGGQYNQLCLGHDTSSNGLITLDSYGGLAAKKLYLRINGELTELPQTGLGGGSGGISYTPSAALGVSGTSASTTAGNVGVTLAGANLTNDDIGEYVAIDNAGGPLSFGGQNGDVVTPGSGWHAGDTITLAGGAVADVYSVTVPTDATVTVVAAGSGGTPGTYDMNGTTLGERGARDRIRLTVTVGASGTIESAAAVTIRPGGNSFIDPDFDAQNEPIDGGGISGLTGAVLSFSKVGVKTLHKRADDAVTYTTPPCTTACSPASTSGTGTGLVFAAWWRGQTFVSTIATVTSATTATLAAAPAVTITGQAYAYGPDQGSEIQAALDAGTPVILPPGPGIILHTNLLRYHDHSILVGQGSGKDQIAPTVLKYVGAVSDGAAQLSADSAVDGALISGAQVGNFELDGSFRAGIGYYQGGVHSSHIYPMQVEGNRILGMQLTGVAGYDNWGNIYDRLFIDQRTPGWDTDGLLIGPGAPKNNGTGGYHDTDASLFKYINVQLDPNGQGEAMYCQTADSNIFLFTRLRGLKGVPGLRLGGSATSDRKFCRANYFLNLDSKGGVLAEGGVKPSSNAIGHYNLRNGAADIDAADVEGDDTDIDPDEGVTAQAGARVISMTSNGTIEGFRIRSRLFADIQTSATRSWTFTVVNDSPTAVPGAAITTGGGDHKVLAVVDNNDTLRVLMPVKVEDLNVTATANKTLTAADSGIVYDNSGAGGAVNLNLPLAARGVRYCGVVVTGQPLAFVAQTGETITYGASTTTAGGNLASSTANSVACLTAVKSGGPWVATSFSGTWAFN